MICTPVSRLGKGKQNNTLKRWPGRKLPTVVFVLLIALTVFLSGCEKQTTETGSGEAKQTAVTADGLEIGTTGDFAGGGSESSGGGITAGSADGSVAGTAFGTPAGSTTGLADGLSGGIVPGTTTGDLEEIASGLPDGTTAGTTDETAGSLSAGTTVGTEVDSTAGTTDETAGNPVAGTTVGTERDATAGTTVGTEVDSTAETAGNPATELTTGSADKIDTVEELVAAMSLHEKVCQMFFVCPEMLNAGETVLTLNTRVRDNLATLPVGGIILFKKNMTGGASRAGNLISDLQASQAQYSYAGCVRIGLFMGVDEEGGRISRVASNLGTTSYLPMYEYRNFGTDTARSNAWGIGRDIAGFGFNLDFAPVADTWSNPENTVIGDRAYSDDYAQTALLVAAAVEGFHRSGVLCVAKHFPGHGDTVEDSHEGSAVSYRSMEELRSGEFLAFQSAIAKGVDMVMVGHITVPAVDSLPASLSRTWITQILRGELGYNGVVITDSMSMGALGGYTSGEAAVAAVLAGNDIILTQTDFPEMVIAVENAVLGGQIPVSRIDEAVTRILCLKEQRGLLIWE